MARAQFVDERELTDEEKAEFSDPTELEPGKETASQEEQEPEQQAAEPEKPEESDLPDKYRGKTPAELVRMHQEAEKLLGRQSSEVGELRKVVDDFIKTQTELERGKAQPQETQEEEDDDLDFFTDPKKAIQRAVEEHPDVVAAREFSRDYKKTTTMAALSQKHPDMAEIVQNPEFSNWVKGSRYRADLFTQADQEYDYEAADELFTMWKQLNPAQPKAEPQPEPTQTAKAQQKEQLKRASTGDARGSSEGRGKKIYRRADIIKLMNNDPDRYRALQPEIMKAYSEGRVR